MSDLVFGIPVVRLTETQKTKVENVLVEGNKLLKKWASFAGARKYRPFRIAVVNGKIKDNVIDLHYAYGTKKTCIIPSHLLPAFQRDLPFMQEAHKVIRSDLGNRNVEESVMQNFVLLISKLAHRVHKSNENSGLTLDDFMQEGLIHLIDSIYNWTPWEQDKDTELSTFVQTSIFRHFNRIMNKNRMTGALKNSDLRLLRKIKKLENDHTFDEIVTILGMTEKQVNRINRIKKVVSMNSRDENKVIDFEDKSCRTYQDNEDKEHFENFIGSCNLTQVEEEIIRLSVTSNRGWQTEYANTHINPTTGKPYSKMRVSQILQEARAKLQANYERV